MFGERDGSLVTSPRRLQPAGPVHFTVVGEPRPKGRPRFGRGRAYTPAATRDAEDAVRWEARKAMRHLAAISGPVTVTLHFYTSNARRVDTDNLAKLVTDACNKIVYTDDSQIVSLHAERHIERPARTDITVAPLGQVLAA